jgi:hypothetical protein
VVDGEVEPTETEDSMMAPATSGVLFVHSAPKALAPHVEWAIASTLGEVVQLEWVEQPVLKGSLRTDYTWHGPVGTAASLASALRGWEHLRFEITEDASLGVDPMRFLHTPDLGIFAASTDAAGNTVVAEDRIKYALEVASGDFEEVQRELRLAIGVAWDEELEPFRHAGETTSVVWLHRTG